jgi:hypothetical protein
MRAAMDVLRTGSPRTSTGSVTPEKMRSMRDSVWTSYSDPNLGVTPGDAIVHAANGHVISAQTAEARSRPLAIAFRVFVAELMGDARMKAPRAEHRENVRCGENQTHYAQDELGLELRLVLRPLATTDTSTHATA